MGKRKFSGLELILMAMFLLVSVVAVTLVVLLATGEPAVITEGGESGEYAAECTHRHTHRHTHTHTQDRTSSQRARPW